MYRFPHTHALWSSGASSVHVAQGRSRHIPIEIHKHKQCRPECRTNQQEERCVKKSILGRRKTKYMSRRTLGWQQSHWRRPHSWFYLAAIDTSTWAGKEKYVFSIHFVRNQAKNYCVTQLQLYTLYKLSSTIFSLYFVVCEWVNEWVCLVGIGVIGPNVHFSNIKRHIRPQSCLILNW